MPDRALPRRRRTTRSRSAGWTVLEVLVVTAILAILVSLIVPLAGGAREHARRVRCASNLRSLGQALFAYAGENGGWLYPVARDPVTGRPVDRFGCQLPPHERWPAIVFKTPAAETDLPYDPASYTMDPYDPATFPAEPFTPDVMRCPSDDAPYEAHSYILNGHLGPRGFQQGSKDLGGRTSDAVVLAGEKRSDQRDYYMQDKDFARVVDAFRHGKTKGSNYLFVDGHVETKLPLAVKGGIDPWDVAARN